MKIFTQNLYSFPNFMSESSEVRLLFSLLDEVYSISFQLSPFGLFPENAPSFRPAGRRGAPLIIGGEFDLLILHLFSFDFQIWIYCFLFSLMPRINPAEGAALLLADRWSALFFVRLSRFCYYGKSSFYIYTLCAP
jgi:hypothetical protein